MRRGPGRHLWRRAAAAAPLPLLRPPVLPAVLTLNVLSKTTWGFWARMKMRASC